MNIELYNEKTLHEQPIAKTPLEPAGTQPAPLIPRRLVGKLQRAYKKAGLASNDEKIRDFYDYLNEELHLDPMTKTSYRLSKILAAWLK